MAQSRGVLVISIDVELAWGVFDLPDAAGFFPAITQTLGIVADLLGLFSRYRVSATWAIADTFSWTGASDRTGQFTRRSRAPAMPGFPTTGSGTTPGWTAARHPSGTGLTW